MGAQMDVVFIDYTQDNINEKITCALVTECSMARQVASIRNLDTCSSVQSFRHQ